MRTGTERPPCGVHEKTRAFDRLLESLGARLLVCARVCVREVERKL